jgi:uncharacterized protein YtpQ (UPF0354 family)
LFWIKELGTAMPYGCNDNMADEDDFFFSSENHGYDAARFIDFFLF